MSTTLKPRLMNLSYKIVPMLQADALVVSVPKSGRTWLRVFLEHYFCTRAGAPVSFTPWWSPRPAPTVYFSHDLWHHLTTPSSAQRMLGVHLIPPQLRTRKQIVLLQRDPKDVLVSLYLHLRKRGFKTGLSYHGSLSQMVRDPRLGIRKLMEIQNHWLAEWGDSERCLTWRYEECRLDPERSFSQILRFLDHREIDEGLLRESIAFADFDNMRAMEEKGTVDRPMLRPGDPADGESYKVRRGVVGGYADYLTPEDICYIEQALCGMDLCSQADAA